MKTLTINRQTWLRGRPQSCLLDDEGYRCCLGFYCQQLGFSDKFLRNVTTPMYLVLEGNLTLPTEAQWLLNRLLLSSQDTVALVHANDGLNRTEPEREAQITAIFARHGIEVIFT